jgi:hypothetical protein
LRLLGSAADIVDAVLIAHLAGAAMSAVRIRAWLATPCLSFFSDW